MTRISWRGWAEEPCFWIWSLVICQVMHPSLLEETCWERKKGRWLISTSVFKLSWLMSMLTVHPIFYSEMGFSWFTAGYRSSEKPPWSQSFWSESLRKRKQCSRTHPKIWGRCCTKNRAATKKRNLHTAASFYVPIFSPEWRFWGRKSEEPSLQFNMAAPFEWKVNV